MSRRSLENATKNANYRKRKVTNNDLNFTAVLSLALPTNLHINGGSVRLVFASVSYLYTYPYTDLQLYTFSNSPHTSVINHFALS
jgi:hypothetical protein